MRNWKPGDYIELEPMENEPGAGWEVAWATDDYFGIWPCPQAIWSQATGQQVGMHFNALPRLLQKYILELKTPAPMLLRGPATWTEILEEVTIDPDRPTAGDWDRYVILIASMKHSVVAARRICGCASEIIACTNCRVAAQLIYAASECCNPSKMVHDQLANLLTRRVENDPIAVADLDFARELVAERDLCALEARTAREGN